MAPVVKLGPTPLASKTSLTPMMKEISQRKSHIDLVFSCDDGSVSGHRFVVGAQSKFLKGLLKFEDHGEKSELRLPGIKILHLKRAVKFMYTGQLKMTKQEIEKEHMVWHVNHILIDLFRVDAKLNLPAHLLQPPPKKPEPDPPPSSGRGRGGGQSRGQNGNSGSSTPSQGGSGSSSPKVSEVDNTRQNTVIPESVPEKEKEDDIGTETNDSDRNDVGNKIKDNTGIESKDIDRNTIENKDIDNNSSERKRHKTGDSDIEEVEQERVPTPDIIDLLDSDPEDDNSTEPQGNLNEESVCPTLDNCDNIENPSDNTDIFDNIINNDAPNDNVPIPEAPKLIQRPPTENTADNVQKPARAVARKHTASFSTKTISQKEQEAEPQEGSSAPRLDNQEISVNPEATKKRAVARKHTGPRGDTKKTKQDDIFTLAMKEAEIEVPSPDLPTARKSVIQHQSQISPLNSFMPPIDVMATFQGLQPLAPSLLTHFQGPSFPPPSFINQSYPIPQLGPTQTIYRGKVTSFLNLSKQNKSTKGVRKHNHIPWTMTGLKRAETFAVVKEEKAIHTCDICGVKYEKYRSLEIHKRRIHNSNARVECPEGCGKLLSSTTAIRKHLLSHRPEEQWPHECPLCHKKFQARGDIPKHLKTRIHANDNIPVMGTKEWFDLIYHDDPNYNYGAMKVKLEKQEARERSKLPAGMYPVGLINLEDPFDNSQSTSGYNEASGAPNRVIVPSQGYLPNISYLEGLDDSDSLLEAITPVLPSTESPLNVLSGSETLAVFAEDVLFSSLGTEASVLL